MPLNAHQKKIERASRWYRKSVESEYDRHKKKLKQLEKRYDARTK